MIESQPAMPKLEHVGDDDERLRLGVLGPSGSAGSADAGSDLGDLGLLVVAELGVEPSDLLPPRARLGDGRRIGHGEPIVRLRPAAVLLAERVARRTDPGFGHRGSPCYFQVLLI